VVVKGMACWEVGGQLAVGEEGATNVGAGVAVITGEHRGGRKRRMKRRSRQAPL